MANRLIVISSQRAITNAGSIGANTWFLRSRNKVQQMLEKDMLQSFYFVQQKSILKLSQLLQCEIAVFENEIFLSRKSVSLHDICPSIALNQVKDQW